MLSGTWLSFFAVRGQRSSFDGAEGDTSAPSLLRSNEKSDGAQKLPWFACQRRSTNIGQAMGIYVRRRSTDDFTTHQIRRKTEYNLASH
jgi:hypothetical protein